MTPLMVFLFEERRAFVRPYTHTVVLDRDEDFADMVASGTGTIARLVRVWTVPSADPYVRPDAYLGSFTVCPSTPLRAQIRKLARRLDRGARRVLVNHV